MGLDPTIAWKASPTRTPPPICASAPFLKPRWSQNRGRREQFNKYTMHDFSQCVDEARTKSRICRCSIETARLESKFLNQRKESRVS
jgi:hypothetical protein